MKTKTKEKKFDVFDDNNYPGSELTLEQEADLIVDRYLDSFDESKWINMKDTLNKIDRYLKNLRIKKCQQ